MVHGIITFQPDRSHTLARIRNKTILQTTLKNLQMGYFTLYKLYVRSGNSERIEKRFKERFPELENIVPFNDWDWVCDGWETRWHDHDEDMRAFSEEFPEEIFVLVGKGEEHGDIWRKYYQNGSVRTANIRVKVEYIFEDDESEDSNPYGLRNNIRLTR